MTSLPSILFLGFALGMRHATDPDHVVAVTAIVGAERKPFAAARVGAMWGLGHTSTILALGGAIILFHIALSPHVGLALEFAVALFLMALGLWNLFSKQRSHSHPHPGPSATPPLAMRPLTMRPLAMGLVHGLAGSAAIALLVLGTIDDASWALVYLAVFGVGTIAGMMVLTTLLAMPISFGLSRFRGAERTILKATGALSLLFGIFVAYKIGVLGGLFSSHPAWNPE